MYFLSVYAQFRSHFFHAQENHPFFFQSQNPTQNRLLSVPQNSLKRFIFRKTRKQPRNSSSLKTETPRCSYKSVMQNKNTLKTVRRTRCRSDFSAERNRLLPAQRQFRSLRRHWTRSEQNRSRSSSASRRAKQFPTDFLYNLP